MNRWLSYAAMVFGALISAIGVNLFVIPNHLASGGIGGLLLILHYLIGTPIGIFYLIANIPLAYWLYRITDWQAIVRTAVGIAAYSFLVDVTTQLSALKLTTNPMLAGIYAGLCFGVGNWVVFYAGGNLGGLALLGMILRRTKGLEINRFLLYTDVAVMGLGGLIFHSMEIALYSWIMSFVAATMMERMTHGLRGSRLVKVYSENAEEIARALLQQVHRGVTCYEGVGAYTGKRRVVVESILSASEIPAARELIMRMDPEALMIVVEVQEAYGRGFTLDSSMRRVPSWKKGMTP